MSKKEKVYIGFLLFFFILLIILEYRAPSTLDWRPSFSKEHKVPFGNYLLFEMLPDLFPEQVVIPTKETIFENAQAGNLSGEFGEIANYVFINDGFDPEQTSLNRLLGFVANGGNAFIACKELGTTLSDTLGIGVGIDYSYFVQQEGNGVQSDSVPVYLSGPKGLAQPLIYYFDRSVLTSYFEVDSASGYEVLGHNHEKQPNFVALSWGEGKIFLHSNPYILTNYYMVKPESAGYISSLFSYLPDRDIIWDEHYKIGKVENRTFLRFVFSKEPLKYAWYLTLAALLVFVLFKSKRKQRAIPIVKPLENTSLEFAETIGELYYQYKDHKNLAEKRINYLKDYIWNQFFIRSNLNNKEFIDKVATKSGISNSEVTDLFNLMGAISLKSQISEEELLLLNQKLEDFYEKTSKHIQPKG